jgi:hypothetical protein
MHCGFENFQKLEFRVSLTMKFLMSKTKGHKQNQSIATTVVLISISFANL